MNLAEKYKDRGAALILFDTDDDADVWNFMVDVLDGHVKELMHPDGYWGVHIPHCGWRRQPVQGQGHATTGSKFLSEFLPARTSCEGEITVFNDRFEIMVYYHDAPTGELRIVKPQEYS